MANLDSYPKPVVDRAFRLQRKIKRDGLEGIGFMNQAFLTMSADADSIAERNIAKNLKQRGF